MDSINLVCAWLDIPPPGDDNSNERHRHHPRRRHHHRRASQPVTSLAEDSFHRHPPAPHQLVNPPPPDAGSHTPVDSQCVSRLDIILPAVTTVASDRGVPVLMASHGTACVSPFPPPPSRPPPSPANVHTYATNLTSIPSVLPRKRNHSTSINAVVSSVTWTIPTPEQVRAKRRALECLVRAANLGLPPASLQTPAFAPHVLAVLRRFAPSEFERGCLPFTPEVASVLDVSFPHEVFSSRARVENLSVDDRPRARTLLDFAIRVHLACVRNYAKGLDEAAWYPSVRSLLSINPSSSRSSSCIPDPPLPEPYVPSPEELFVTIDATIKTTRKAILPGHPNVKLDYLLAFNPKHVDCVSTAATLRQRNLFGNAFNDVSLEESIVILGVEVKTPGGTQSEPGAEYHQVGVWAAKTLELARAMLEEPAPLTAACDLAISLTVYGHAWSIHLTYWLTPTLQITHGPVMVGSTDTLYGTLKIIRFITEFKQWARSTVLGDWKTRIASATMG